MPWLPGPPDGRYLVRSSGAGIGVAGGDAQQAEPTHVLVFTTLAAPRRRGRPARAGRPLAGPQPQLAAEPVASARVTVIDAANPFPDEQSARGWLADAGEDGLAAGLRTLADVLHTFGAATADPHVRAPGRGELLVARIGYGAGEQVADGRWSDARELPAPSPRRRRARVLEPQARLAAALSGRLPVLLCEQLAPRARQDLDAGRGRAAALELREALAAALAELRPAMAGDMRARIEELEAQVERVSEAAAAALRGELGASERAAVSFALGRLEAALRARAAASS